jgi:hypothetical protein
MTVGGDNSNPDDDNDGYTDADEETANQSDSLDAGSVPPDNDLDMVSDLNDYDDDNDGMPDTWEGGFESLDPKSDDAEEDPDEDGQDNYSEYVAETDPTNAESVFAAVDLALEAGRYSISWSSVPGKIYRVLHSLDLVSWTAVSDIIEASEGGTTDWTDPMILGESKGYYRIEVLP